jgi:hypothetical protein
MSCQSFFSQTEMMQPVEVDFMGPERWSIRDRLLELDIPVTCAMGEPLRVEIATVQAAVQLWGVMRSYELPRSQLIGLLECCFELSVSKP